MIAGERPFLPKILGQTDPVKAKMPKGGGGLKKRKTAAFRVKLHCA